MAVVCVNLAAYRFVVRWDLTSDHRYSLSPATKELLRSTDGEIEATLYLAGSLNSGFQRLRGATREMLEELSVYGNIRVQTINPNNLSEREQQQLQQRLARQQYMPTAIYERDRQGRQSETIVYPFVLLEYEGREQWVSLLTNQRGQSGSENLNSSIESLEYLFAEAIHRLRQTERSQIAFLEGQGELPEQNTADIQQALARYFDVYRGSITDDADCLNPFRAVVVADPQLPFSERDKYVIDRYLMQGGTLLWCLNGVQFSQQVLSDAGFTPVIPLDLNLTDMLFRYGVRVNAHLIQDVQCLPVPVDVSQDPERPQYQPMPWYFAPLLLTNPDAPITRNLTQVNALFPSDISLVGGEDGIEKNILLVSSNASRVIPTPGEVDLSDLNADLAQFNFAYVPIGVSLEGSFPSVFAHRMPPEGVSVAAETPAQSVTTRQVVVACGSVPRNELEQGRPLPAGYDRYSHMQFGNRDFIVNAVLWLTDDQGLLQLRQKTLPLRLLNEKSLRANLLLYQLLSTLVPLCLLALTAVGVLLLRKQRYTR